MAAMLHARNNTILFLWDKMFILMPNIFIVPGMQHGRHAKLLFFFLPQSFFIKYNLNLEQKFSNIYCTKDYDLMEPFFFGSDAI